MATNNIESYVLEILNNNNWLVLPIMFHIIGFWISIIHAHTLARQVRCLHFCWCGMSDWAIEKLQEVHDNYIQYHGAECAPFTLLNAESEWKTRLSHDFDYQNRAGVKVPKDNHINYAWEDLSS